MHGMKLQGAALWRRLAGLLRACSRLLGGLALLGLAQAAQAQSGGWRECAREGQMCQLDGRGVVRYGVDGQWSSRVLSGRILCGNDLFGDPAPQQPKRCEVRDAGSGAQGWVFCAAEGETCRLRGSGEVRFGADRQYTVRRAHNAIRCDVEAFGDPIYGQTKHCEVRANVALSRPGGDGWQGGGGGWDDDKRWRQCASEGQTCHVQGRAEVRFGDGRRFASRTVRGAVLCSPSVFGDPAYGVVKHCEVRANAFGGWGDSGPGDGGWSHCADEGGRCDVGPGRVQVRFGTRGRYVYRDVYGGVNCDLQAFGPDPYPNEKKQCELRR